MNCNLKRRRQYVKINLCNFSKKKVYASVIQVIWFDLFSIDVYTPYFIACDGRQTNQSMMSETLVTAVFFSLKRTSFDNSSLVHVHVN